MNHSIKKKKKLKTIKSLWCIDILGLVVRKLDSSLIDSLCSKISHKYNHQYYSGPLYSRIDLPYNNSIQDICLYAGMILPHANLRSNYCGIVSEIGYF